MKRTNYAIINARVVSRDKVLDRVVVLTRDSKIEAVVDQDSWETIHRDSGNYEVMDADGAWLMPGMVDIHADYIEHMAAPRPTSLMDFRVSLREAEKELVCHGISTMFHSLSFYRESEFGNKPVRKPENVRKLINVIDEVHQGKHLVRHRFHARIEVDCLDALGYVENYIDEGKLHLLSFMDHTPGQGQYRNLEIFKDTLQGYRNLSGAEVDAIIAKHQAKEVLSMEAIAKLARKARSKGVAVASHDDDTVEKIQLVKEYGTTISEFPITIEVARAAQAAGLATVAGAPNILLGGSHSGNLSAAEAIKAGAIDILCSDYYPAAMLHSVFYMVRNHGQDMAAMTALVSANPAAATGLGDQLGSISPGLKADLLVVRELPDGFPAIESVFIDGVLVSQNTYRSMA